jgi:hypothetical protein
MFLVVIDALSKWPEVSVMHTTANNTIDALHSLFARFGLPEQVVSDNGPQFVSDEISQFLNLNGINNIRSAPYHPSSNGLAERFIQTMKQALKASEAGRKSLPQRLAQFIFEYRASPHATTSSSPNQLFLGRQMRTRFDLLHPSVNSQVLAKQESQKLHHDLRSKSRDFAPDQHMMVRDYHLNANKWTRGKIINQLGPVTYEVETEGKIVKWHVDQLRSLPEVSPELDTGTTDPVEDNFVYPSSVEQKPNDGNPGPSESRYPQRGPLIDSTTDIIFKLSGEEM